jgi:WD40 repeat protein
MSDFPYPGLRPFQRDEIDIFFGREPHVDQLIKRLGQTHFLAVVGLSGCGKSSLIRTGLWSDLETGFLAQAGARWQVAELRPGHRPFASLAKALLKTDWGRNYLPQLTDRTEAAAFLQAQLRRISLVGIHSVLQETPLPADTNLLLFVDQFEEIFRYYQQGDAEEAEAFVAFLLASSQPSPRFSEEKHRIYVVITMRSDFLGNCALFAGLSEAINEGQFLVPRLTRAQLREAIEFPARVFGGEIEATLVNQLLNDAGTDFDQLPLLQHALMRMWKFARAENPEQIIITLKHYDQIGNLANALSQHADKVYAKLNPDQQRIAEILFRSLCEYGSDNRDTRRPVKLEEVATLANVPWEQVAAVVEEFRKPWRSFLMPPVGKTLELDSVLDIIHESLIRKWRRLKHWAQEEAESAKLYRRLEDSAVRWQQKQAALWHSPDLEIAVAWREKNQPTAQWAKRYGQRFELAMQFLEKGEKERRREQLERELARQRLLKLKQARKQTIWAVVGMIGAIMLAGWGLWQRSLVLQLEKDNRFESQLSQATLLAHDENYAATKKVLDESRQLDKDISDASRRHARNLLARFTDIMGGEPQQTYLGAEAPLYSVAVSPDGRLLAAAGEWGKLVLFDLSTSKLLRCLKEHTKAVTALAFHPQGKWLVSAEQSDTIIFWSVPSGEKYSEWLTSHEEIKALAMSPDSKYLASGGENGNIILWDVETGKEINVFKGHTKSISDDGLAFDSTGELLASASLDKTARLWEVKTGKLLRTLAGHTEAVENLAFSSDNKWLATSSSDKSIRLWEVNSGNILKAFHGHRALVSGLSFVAGRNYLVSASSDRTLRIWDTNSGVTLRVLQGHTGPVTGITTYNGQVFSASHDGTVKVWAPVLPYQHIIDFEKDKPISVAIAPDGKRVATGFKDGALRLYSLPDLKLLWEKKSHADQIQHLAFNFEGTMLASASFDGTARLWQIDQDTLQEQLPPFKIGKKVYAVAFSPDAHTLAVAAEKEIILFSVATKQKYLVIPQAHQGEYVTSISFDTSNRHLLSSGGGGYTRLWNLNQQPLLPQDFSKAQGIVFNSSFSPDDQWVAGVGHDSLVKIYVTHNRQLRYRLEGHEQTIFGVLFSPDSQQVASVGGDGTVRIWDFTKERELFKLSLPTSLPTNGSTPLLGFDFRCTPQGCFLVVPIKAPADKLVGYDLGKIYD